MAMFQGNWKCSGCGAAITELPFQPRSTEGLLCRACHAKQKGGAPPRRESGEKKAFSGNWSCSNCNADITSLPFEPRDTSKLLCIECFKKTRAV